MASKTWCRFAACWREATHGGLCGEHQQFAAKRRRSAGRPHHPSPTDRPCDASTKREEPLMQNTTATAASEQPSFWPWEDA